MKTGNTCGHRAILLCWLVIGSGILIYGLPCRSAVAGTASLTAVDEIRLEASRANDDPGGRPLPLASHWNAIFKTEPWTFDEQLLMIEQGHHLLPWLNMPLPSETSDKAIAAFIQQYEGAIKKARAMKLPLVLISTQWENLLSKPPYFNFPADQNPNVVLDNGTVQPKVSPFGPVDPWRQVGKSWTTTPQLKILQHWYPDPPRIIFLSNNEHPKLTWPEVEGIKRYRDAYGKGRSKDFRRQVVADGWIERYRAMQKAMRDGLVGPAWQKNALFVGYEAFGPAWFGRWDGWPEHSLHHAGQIDPYPLMWDGGSPSYYVADFNTSTDHTVFSPQIEFMNLVFMRKKALEANPKFWLEISVWDGYDGAAREKQYPSKPSIYRLAGQTYNPARYEGFVQYGMWLLRPRAIREYRGHTFPANALWEYMMAIVKSVDRVYSNPILRKFWRDGELVPNRAHRHPYQCSIPAEYQNVDRWFLLDADVNPQQYPWESFWRVPVYSLALVEGIAPARQWLIYAHAPLAVQKSVARTPGGGQALEKEESREHHGVRLTLPGYGDLTVNVPAAGAFYLVDEKTRTVQIVR